MLISWGTAAIVMLWLSTCTVREGFFLVQFMDFKMPISSSQMLEINRESQQMDPLCIKSKSHVCHCHSGAV